MREPEQRVTALLNGEIEIASSCRTSRVARQSAPNAQKFTRELVEIMFLGDDVRVTAIGRSEARQALCYAIDRDLIIKNVLKGQADRLDGPDRSGPVRLRSRIRQARPTIPYEPAKARELLQGVGYNNEPVLSRDPVGRAYVSDKEVTEANDSRCSTRSASTPSSGTRSGATWATCNEADAVRRHGPRLGVDPSPALSQYFETGGSPRIGDPDRQIDKTLATERVTFDRPTARSAQHLRSRRSRTPRRRASCGGTNALRRSQDLVHKVDRAAVSSAPIIVK